MNGLTQAAVASTHSGGNCEEATRDYTASTRTAPIILGQEIYVATYCLDVGLGWRVSRHHTCSTYTSMVFICSARSEMANIM